MGHTLEFRMLQFNTLSSMTIFFQAEDGIRDLTDWSSDVCSSDLIKGIPAVKRALVIEEKGEWIVRTEGSSLALALEVPGVDTSRTVSNNINETALVLGIEAARNVIVKEALGVLEEQGLDVDVRHVMLVADMMTSSGDVLQ